MRSHILQITARYLLPLLLIFSVLILLRGHNNPGGGFIGGLLASAAFALYAIAHSVEAARAVLRIDPRTLLTAGLAVALTSGLPALLAGLPFMAGRWVHPEIPGMGALPLGTPLWFDLGVFLAVIGFALTILFALWEED